MRHGQAGSPHAPSDHSTMSRSITRAPQRSPLRRPKARSIALRRREQFGRRFVAFDDRDGVGVAAAGRSQRGGAHDRRDGGHLPQRRTAAATSRSGGPWRPGRFDPSAMA